MMGYKLIFHFPKKTRSLLPKQLAQFPLNWLLYHIFLLYILIIHLSYYFCPYCDIIKIRHIFPTAYHH